MSRSSLFLSNDHIMQKPSETIVYIVASFAVLKDPSKPPAVVRALGIDWKRDGLGPKTCTVQRLIG